MLNYQGLHGIVWVVFCILFVASSLSAHGQGNKSPNANAGADQTVTEGDSVTLDGSASSADMKYAWKQETGEPEVTLNNANIATPTFTAPTVSADTTLTFKLTVTDSNGEEADDTVDVVVQKKTPLESAVERLDRRLTTLEQKERPLKLLRLKKDVEFLYQTQIGRERYWFNNPSGKCQSHQGLRADDESFVGVRTRLRSDIIFKRGTDVILVIKDKKLREKTVGGKLSDQCKLDAVEDYLKISCADCNSKARVEKIYTAVEYPEWKRDRFRFGVLIGRVKEIDAISTSIILHVFPTYRRFMPGEIDLIRRMSLYFAVGSVDKPEDVAKVNGPAYSLGIAFEIAKGFTVAYGRTFLEFKEEDADPFKRESPRTIGITLTTDLWRDAFKR